jgi:endogenous inhibitor of DNA gyrase (YacG/DUF329 family)
MTVTCDRCAAYIETGNRRWPGFCSAKCRDRDRADRDRDAADLAQRRRDAAQHRRATAARHRTLHLT